MATNVAPVLSFSWDALQDSKPWQALTLRQRLWCLSWLTNGHDSVDATQFAYKVGSPRNATCLNYEVRSNKRVLAFLSLYELLTQGAPTREVQIAGVLDTIREAPPYEQVKARRLLAQLTGLVDKTEDGEPEADESPEADPSSHVAPPARFKVGSIAIQDGKQYRVLAVDSDGRILRTEEI